MTIDIKVVKVVAVEEDAEIQKKDGGFYRALKLTYDLGGQVSYKAVHTGMLDKFKDAVEGIRASKPGDKVELHLEKNGQFTNLVNVVKTDKPLTSGYKKYSGGGGGGGGNSGGYSSADNQLGQQIGNAVTNAVALAIAKEGKDVKLKTVEAFVVELVAISTKVKKSIATGTTSKTETTKVSTEEKEKENKKAEVTKPVEVEDDTYKDIFED